MTDELLPVMSPYDVEAWQKVKQAKQNLLTRSTRRMVPEAVRKRVAGTGTAVKRNLEKVKGVPKFQEMFTNSLAALFQQGVQAAFHTLDEKRVIAAYRKAGYEIATLADIRSLDLADIDKVMPNLRLAYSGAATLEGAAAGLATTAAPLAGPGGPAVVVATIATDSAAVLIASFRLVAHTGMYYGYDIRSGAEDAEIAFSVLGTVIADDATKVAAYRELSKVTQAMLRRNAVGKGKGQVGEWTVRRLDKVLGIPLDNHKIVQLAQQLLKSFGFRAGSKEISRILPFFGIVIGAGQNAQMLNKAFGQANNHYREMSLREKYQIIEQNT